MTVASPASLYSDLAVDAETDAPLGKETWYGIGGSADVLIHPHTIEALQILTRRCFRDGVPLRVLGSGANLLVDDQGVDGVVVKLNTPAFKAVEWNADGLVERMRVFGGAQLEPLIHECSRRGLSGIEQMAGIPASLGGAIRMNAGGKFGAIGDSVDAVAVMHSDGEIRVYSREELHFGYRETSLKDSGGVKTPLDGIILWSSLRMRSDDPVACRARVREIFAYKASTQPMGAASAGCMFRNPTMPDGRVESAGRLIDLAGLKGRRVGGAFVSTTHGNFLAVDRGARAEEMRELVEIVQAEVAAKFGVMLRTEVVFWKRGDAPQA